MSKRVQAFARHTGANLPLGDKRAMRPVEMNQAGQRSVTRFPDATYHTRTSDVERRELHREMVRRGARSEIRFDLVNAPGRDERADATTRRKVAPHEHMFDAEANLSDAVKAEILRQLRTNVRYAPGRTHEVVARRQRERNVQMFWPSEQVIARLTARFAKLAAKHSRERAEAIMRSVVAEVVAQAA